MADGKHASAPGRPQGRGRAGRHHPHRGPRPPRRANPASPAARDCEPVAFTDLADRYLHHLLDHPDPQRDERAGTDRADRALDRLAVSATIARRVQAGWQLDACHRAGRRRFLGAGGPRPRATPAAGPGTVRRLGGRAGPAAPHLRPRPEPRPSHPRPPAAQPTGPSPTGPARRRARPLTADQPAPEVQRRTSSALMAHLHCGEAGSKGIPPATGIGTRPLAYDRLRSRRRPSRANPVSTRGVDVVARLASCRRSCVGGVCNAVRARRQR